MKTHNFVLSLAFLVFSSCGQNDSESTQPQLPEVKHKDQQIINEQSNALITKGELKFSKIDKFKKQLKPISPDSSYYVHTNIETSDEKRIIEISANELIMEEGHAQGIFELIHNQEDIKKITLNANSITVSSQINLPNAKVVIQADTLIFTQTGQINVTPIQPTIAAPTKDGRNGITAPAMEIIVDNYYPSTAQSIHFVSNGTKGEDAGPGIPGEPGKSVAPVKGKNIIADCRLPKIPMQHFTHNQQAAKKSFVTIQSSCNRAFPTSGKNAKAAGRPGSAGNGGIIISNKEKVAQNISNHAGRPGKYGKDVPGGQPGTPTVSYKYFASGRKSGAHKTSVGQDAKAPKPDKDSLQADDGEFRQAVRSPKERFNTTFAKARLDYAKDLFRYGHDTKARKIFSEIVFNSKESKDPEIQNSQLQAAQYLQMISKGLDYHSFSDSYIPALSLEATGLAYKSEIKSSIDLMAVSRWMNVKERGFQEAQQALEKQQELLVDQMRQARSAHQKAVHEIPEVHQLMNDTLYQYDLVQSQHDLIEKKLEREARDNLRDPFLVQALNMGSTLASVMPAGQPAVGQIGMGINSLLKLQDNGSFNIKAVPDAIKALTQDIDWEKSANNWNEFYAPYRFSNIKNQDFEDQVKTAKDMVSHAKPIFNAMKEQLKSWQGPALNLSEYQQELARLKRINPEFTKLAKRIEKLNQKRAEFESKLSKLLTTISQTQSKVASLTLEIAEINNKNFEVNGKLNPELIELINSRAELAEANLQKYHALLVRSYQHRLLESYPHELDLQRTHQHIEDIISKSDSPFLQARQYDLIEDTYKSELSRVLNSIVDRNLVRGQEFQKTNSLALNNDEVEALNKYGEVYIDLTDRNLFQKDETKLRIQDIVVHNLDIESTHSLNLEIAHRGEGHLSDGEEFYYFQYQKPDTQDALFRWGASYSPEKGTFQNWEKTSSQRDLFVTFLDEEIGASNFDLYVKPAALTTLKLSVETQGNYQIRDLEIDLSYSFH